MTLKQTIITLLVASIWCLTSASGSFLLLLANAQQPVSNHIPILLIHGYAEDYHIWDSWINWLKVDHFNMTEVKAITFSNDDECGPVEAHAAELNNIVNKILHDTGSEKVNIVAHSKGGLEARWYIAHNSIDKVANLIMIGTPDTGTTAAYVDLTSCAGSTGLEDLQPDSKVTQAVDKIQSTHYYTVAGNYATPCYFVGGFRFTCYLIPSDGLVTVSSAQSTYSSLGVFPYNHTGLVTYKDVYERVLPILSTGGPVSYRIYPKG